MRHRIWIILIMLLGKVSIAFPDDDFVKFRELFQDGKYKETLKYIPKLEESQNLRKYEIVEFLNHGITVFEHFGNFNKALAFQNKLKSYIVSPNALYNLNVNMADNYCRLGQYDKALSVLDSLEVSPATISRQANIYFYQDKIDSAISSLYNLLESSHVTATDSASIIHNIGFLHLEKKDWNEAIKYIEKSLSTLSPLNRSIAEANVALAYAHTGDSAKALSYINAALKWQQTNLPKNHPEILTTELIKAQVLNLIGEAATSLKSFESYFQRKKTNLIETLQDLTYEDRISYWYKEKKDLSKCFILENQAPQFLYDVALFRRLTSLLGTNDLDALRKYLSLNAGSIKKSLKPTDAAIEFITYKDSDDVERYAAILLTRSHEAKFIPLFDEDFLYKSGVVRYGSIFDVIKCDDPRDKNSLYRDSVLGDLVWSPILNSLPPKISNIYFTPEGIFNFWGIENMPFKNKEKFNIHRLTTTAYLAIPSKPVPQTDGILLLGGMDYSSVPQDSVSDCFSHVASELLRRQVGSEAVFSYLPGTRNEVDSIARILEFPDVLYSIGEARLKELLPNFKIVHLSTHGYSLNLGIRKSPEFLRDNLGYDQSLNACCVALSGANVLDKYPNREDGLLSAREICDLDLSNVEFVILSACQTAQGDIVDEGSAGLVRGLKNAGVKTIIATLWSVDDRSTMIFMQHFYRLLKEGFSKYDAFIGAQKYLQEFQHTIPYRKFSVPTLSRDRNILYHITTYDAPYYWAPFILIDDLQ